MCKRRKKWLNSDCQNKINRLKALYLQGVLAVFLFVVCGVVWANASTPVVSQEVLQDPTKPFHVASESNTKQPVKTAVRTPATVYQLQAIIVRPGERKALINGEWLQEFQQKKGITLNRVNNNSVDVQIAGKSLHLPLNPSIIQRPVSNRPPHETGQP